MRTSRPSITSRTTHRDCVASLLLGGVDLMVEVRKANAHYGATVRKVNDGPEDQCFELDLSRPILRARTGRDGVTGFDGCARMVDDD
jgi:hypothetical protein